jgi:hypothetical protein
LKSSLGCQSSVEICDEFLNNGASGHNGVEIAGNLPNFEFSGMEVALEHAFFGAASAE